MQYTGGPLIRLLARALESSAPSPVQQRKAEKRKVQQSPTPSIRKVTTPKREATSLTEAERFLRDRMYSAEEQARRDAVYANVLANEKGYVNFSDYVDPTRFTEGRRTNRIPMAESNIPRTDGTTQYQEQADVRSFPDKMVPNPYPLADVDGDSIPYQPREVGVYHKKLSPVDKTYESDYDYANVYVNPDGTAYIAETNSRFNQPFDSISQAEELLVNAGYKPGSVYSSDDIWSHPGAGARVTAYGHKEFSFNDQADKVYPFDQSLRNMPLHIYPSENDNPLGPSMSLEKGPAGSRPIKRKDIIYSKDPQEIAGITTVDTEPRFRNFQPIYDDSTSTRWDQGEGFTQARSFDAPLAASISPVNMHPAKVTELLRRERQDNAARAKRRFALDALIR